MNTSTLDCFFISPFGDKHDQMGGGTMPHFELVRSAIKEIMESFPDVPIQLRRADEIANVGSVDETFIGALQKADIVVAELSATGNANVFYELGIRFALRRAITIPIWQKGTKLPADVRNVLGIEYEPTNPISKREDFYKFLRSRLGSLISDSPVYRVLPDLHISSAAEISLLRDRVKELEGALTETKLDQSIQLVWDDAETFLRKNDVQSALNYLKVAYVRAPKNVRLAVRYGQLLSRTEKHDEAISVLHTAVALASEAGGPTFIPCRELGMAYKRASKPQLAIDWLVKAVEQQPSDSDTHGIIGAIYKDAYEIDKAIESYQRGFDVDTKSTYCLLNIICLLHIRGSSGDKLKMKRLLPITEELTTIAVSAIGADHWARYDRGHFLLFSGRIEDAINVFSQALSETKTIGELRSARKNLDLLRDAGTNMAGLAEMLSIFDQSETGIHRMA